MDDQLEQLRRAWTDSKGVEEGAAYLTARVRAGELKRTRVRVAAFLGFEPARRLFPKLVPPEGDEKWRDALTRLKVVGEFRLRLIVAAGRLEDACLPPDASHALLLRVFERFVLSKRQERDREVVRSAVMEELETEFLPIELSVTSVGQGLECATGLRRNTQVAALNALQSGLSALLGFRGATPLPTLRDEDGFSAALERLRAALVDELVPWLLLEGDPLADRVASEAEGSG